MPDPMSILVVDDDADVRAALALVLRDHHVRHAADAKSALKELQQGSFDVVISDYEMGGMSGLDFLQLVRLQRPNIFRVLLTGNATLEVAARALNEQSAHRLLLKPFQRIDLLGMLEMALRGHHKADDEISRSSAGRTVA